MRFHAGRESLPGKRNPEPESVWCGRPAIHVLPQWQAWMAVI
jgi:hypothetical protein